MRPRGIRRRAFLTGAGAVLASPLVSGAQPSNKSLTRIGWLSRYTPDFHAPEGRVFLEEMNRYGYVLDRDY
jgi:hypothetical protein